MKLDKAQETINSFLDNKVARLNRNHKIGICAAAVLVPVVVFYFLAFAPKNKEISRLKQPTVDVYGLHHIKHIPAFDNDCQALARMAADHLLERLLGLVGFGSTPGVGDLDPLEVWQHFGPRLADQVVAVALDECGERLDRSKPARIGRALQEGGRRGPFFAEKLTNLIRVFESADLSHDVGEVEFDGLAYITCENLKGKRLVKRLSDWGNLILLSPTLGDLKEWGINLLS